MAPRNDGVGVDLGEDNAMAAREKGVIINIIGAAGESVQSVHIAGSSGNASLMAFTRAMGATAPRDGLRAVGINPGLVETDRMTTRRFAAIPGSQLRHLFHNKYELTWTKIG
jgi:NAD(P)-dependent dehydrogenase (short-subunit alcohol dehydrogenase family)